MRRMIPNKLINWIKSLVDTIVKNGNKVEIGGSVEIDDEIEAQNIGADLSNAISDSLVGSYVRIMSAPTSATLTDEQIDEIVDGRFIDGNFLGLKNPTFFPGEDKETAFYGMYIGMLTGSDSHQIGAYSINKSTKTISLAPSTTRFTVLNNLYKINNKTWPIYPTDTRTYTLKIVDGTVSWVADE